MIESFLAKLKLPQDKLHHFFYGFLVFNVLQYMLGSWVAFVLLALIAVGKEVYDYRTPGHTPEVADAVYTIAPAVVQVLLS